MADVRRVAVPIDDPAVPSVTAALHPPAPRPAPGSAPGSGGAVGLPVLLTHGAGGDLDAEGLVALAEVLAAAGHPVVRVNLPYREAGRRATPRAERSVEPLRAIADAVGSLVEADGPWILGGKSYGGRVASLAVADGHEAAGLLFYGYPLHPPGRQDALRVDHWHAVGVPCLFLQGDRDVFCDLTLLDAQLRKLPRRSTVHVVAGGDHSLRVTRAASPRGEARSPRRSIEDLAPKVVRWVAGLEG